MYKRLISMLYAVIMLLLLCSCQLAREDGDAGQAADRLIGVYITKEYLDLFDMEGYLDDNISSIMKSNGHTIQIEDDAPYQQRIFAKLESETHIDEETGEKYETKMYVFDDLDGISFFAPRITEPDGSNYIAIGGSNVICDAHHTVGTDSSLEGTVYIEPGRLNTIYVNPVYQGGDGRVYLRSGQGFSFSGIQSEGIFFTQTMEEKHTVTENGEIQEESFKVILNVALKYSPDSVTVVQLDTHSIPISREKYLPAELPGSLAIHPETAYVIVETRSKSPSDDTVSRELFEAGDEYFTGFHIREDGFFEPVPVSLLWE